MATDKVEGRKKKVGAAAAPLAALPSSFVRQQRRQRTTNFERTSTMIVVRSFVLSPLRSSFLSAFDGVFGRSFDDSPVRSFRGSFVLSFDVYLCSGVLLWRDVRVLAVRFVNPSTAGWIVQIDCMITYWLCGSLCGPSRPKTVEGDGITAVAVVACWTCCLAAGMHSGRSTGSSCK
mgnify:CR=1 FL=1